MFKDQKHSIEVQKKLQKCNTLEEMLAIIEKEFNIVGKKLIPELRDFLIHKLVMILQGFGSTAKSAAKATKKTEKTELKADGEEGQGQEEQGGEEEQE